jgi:hypothetical protein
VTPNHTFDRSAKRQRRSVPVTLRVPAPGQCERWALLMRQIATFISALALLAWLDCSLAETETSESSSVAQTGVGYKTVGEALKALKAKPSAKVSLTKPDAWTIVTETDTMAQWSFTPPNHYAYPAVVKRVIKQNANGDVYVEMSALCEAKKEPCDKLIEEFKELNERMRESIQKRLQRQ